MRVRVTVAVAVRVWVLGGLWRLGLDSWVLPLGCERCWDE